MSDSWSLSTPIARLISNDELTKASGEDFGSFSSAVQKLKGQARVHFDCVAVPITNERWRERWRGMCSQPAENFLDGLDDDDDSDDETDTQTEIMSAEEREKGEKAERWRASPSFLKNECNMVGLDEAESVIGIVSDWLHLDSPDEWLRHDYEIALKQELAYASYLGLSSVILPPPVERSQAASYGRALRSCLESSHFLQLVVRLPLYDPSILSSVRKGTLPSPALSATSGSPGGLAPGAVSPGLGAFSVPPSPSIEISGNPFIGPGRKNTQRERVSASEMSGTWEVWDTIRSVCGYSPRVTLALDLTLPLPSTQAVLSRWFAEPISHMFLPAKSFIPNVKGYPVLPKGTQIFLQDMMRSHPTIILSETSDRIHPRGAEDKYVDYIRYLEKSSPHVKRAKEPNTLENYAQGYQDFLQMPLQPLQDHLASMVYENFERDPVKYQKYEEAVLQALSDGPADNRIVLTVAGAGRGPLVARSLRAVERSGRNVFIYAIEKNPNAHVTLQQRQENEWKDKVQVLFGDMRHLEVPEKADILVSELLGSFGDNELSPECLDGAMRFLKEDGISIPSSYTAFLAPIQSAKLHNEAGGSKEAGDKGKEKGLETPYVVMLQAINFLSGHNAVPIHGLRCGERIQRCWEFEHPRRDAVLDPRGLPITNTHNTRSATLTFAIPHAGILHGFAGYFEAVLYGNIGLSIHPERKDAISKDMLSWFPCFFPIKEPLYLPSNSELRVSLWRLTGTNKVWYEWFAEAFLSVPPGSLAASSSAPPMSPPPGPRVNGAGALIAPSPSSYAASPLIDAVDLSFASERSVTPDRDELSSVVKIGQTSLHNPGGRSSWYGL